MRAAIDGDHAPEAAVAGEGIGASWLSCKAPLFFIPFLPFPVERAG